MKAIKAYENALDESQKEFEIYADILKQAKEIDVSIRPLVSAEDAIELTTSAFSAWEGEYETGDDWSKEHEARDLAINALRKQIPELPNVWGDGYADGEPVYDMWDCPSCGETYEIEGEQHEYCPHCGQKIDWSEREEE